MTNTLLLYSRYLLRDLLASPSRTDPAFLACVQRCDELRTLRRQRLSTSTQSTPSAELGPEMTSNLVDQLLAE